MKTQITRILTWLAGKKTYLLVVLLVLTVVVLVATGHMTAETGWATLLLFLGLFAASFRSAIAAHPAQAQQLFTEAVTLFRAALARDPKTTEAAGLALATDGAALASEIQADKTAAQAKGATTS